MYRQYVNDSPVIGSGIAVSLGEGGELLDISKDWSTLAYTGEGPIISAEKALEKLNRQEMLIPLKCSIIGIISPGCSSGTMSRPTFLMLRPNRQHQMYAHRYGSFTGKNREQTASHSRCWSMPRWDE